MTSRRIDLFIVLALVAFSGLVLGLWPAGSALRWIVGILLVLVLPGYALEAALFEPGWLAPPMRLLIIVGLSLAIAVIGGLVLYWTPFGLQAGTWYVWIAIITVSASLVGLARYPHYHSALVGAITLGNLRSVALLGVACLVAGAAVAVSRLPAPPDNAEGYTQLWMVPVLEGTPPVVRLGISSSEFSLVKYRLQVTLDGQMVLDQRDIALAPGDQWTRILALPASLTSGRLEASLYRLDDPNTVYRHVQLQLGPSAK